MNGPEEVKSHQEQLVARIRRRLFVRSDDEAGKSVGENIHLHVRFHMVYDNDNNWVKFIHWTCIWVTEINP